MTSSGPPPSPDRSRADSGALEQPPAQPPPDDCFADPLLAAAYDALDPDRSDLELYRRIAAEAGATTVLDVGCGTGALALLLAADGLAVVGVDPAAASVAVARAKPSAEQVRWVEGEIGALHGAGLTPRDGFDLATMTANVAQVFVDDTEWSAVLAHLARLVRPGGLLVFETRRPDDRAWERWTPAATTVRADVDGVGPVSSEVEVTAVEWPLVRFRTTFNFDRHGTKVSTSTLRFREIDEIGASLSAAGFEVREVVDAPDRPGREWVVIAERTASQAETDVPPRKQPPA